MQKFFKCSPYFQLLLKILYKKLLNIHKIYYFKITYFQNKFSNMFLEFQNCFQKQFSSSTLALLVVFTLYVIMNNSEIESFHNAFS